MHLVSVGFVIATKDANQCRDDIVARMQIIAPECKVGVSSGGRPRVEYCTYSGTLTDDQHESLWQTLQTVLDTAGRSRQGTDNDGIR